LFINSDFAGNSISDSNFRFRFFLIFLCGLVAFGSAIYWRGKLLLSQEYVSFPQEKVHHHNLKLTSPAAQAGDAMEKEPSNNGQN